MRPTPSACASSTSASRRAEVDPCFCRWPVARVSTSSTVSSGAASPPREIGGSAEISRGPLGAVAAVELRRALGRYERRHQLVQVPGHDLIELVKGELDAVIGDAILFEVVSADLLGPVATAHHAPPLRADGRLLLRKLHVI